MNPARLAASGLQQTVLDGSLLLAVPIAVAAGLVSFLSPCVLPLVPGYLGYVTGLTGEALERQRRGRMVAGIGWAGLVYTRWRTLRVGLARSWCEAWHPALVGSE